MPELPEVEVVKKSLKKTINHLTIKKIEIHNRFLRYKIDERLMQKMIKSKILSVSRRSKYILLKLNNNYTLLIHLGMTGKVIIIDSKNIKRKSSFYFKLSDDKPAHNHLTFTFNGNIKLIYNDIRKFGFIKIEESKKLLLNSHLKKLGPEPLSKNFHFQYFKNFIRGKSLSIKDLLMNQSFVAGLGNIYVNEALHVSKISPNRKGRNISLIKCYELVKNIKNILKNAIKAGGTTIKDHMQPDGNLGYFKQKLRVYGRSGYKCIMCKAKIKEIKHSGRTSFYCGVCQR